MSDITVSYFWFFSDLASPEPLRRTSRVKRRLLPDIVSSPPPTKADKSDESASLGKALPYFLLKTR